MDIFEQADKLGVFKQEELEFSSFPDFWYRCFSVEHEDSGEYLFRNFVAQAVHRALKGRRPPQLRALLTMTPSQLIRSYILKRAKANFPNKEFDEMMEELRRKRDAEKAKKYTNRKNFSAYRVKYMDRELKLFEQKREDFSAMQVRVRQLSRVPEYWLFVEQALLGQLDQNSNVARQGVMFVLGYWFVMLDELLQRQIGEDLVSVCMELFDRIIGKRLEDERERTVVREAVRGSLEVLLFFGRYILEMFKVCMFTYYKPSMPGTSPIDKNLLYVFPNMKLVNWMGFHRNDTISSKLPDKIQEIFPLQTGEGELKTAEDIERYERELSPRRVIGIATRSETRYRQLAKELFRLIRLDIVNNRGPHLHGMYLDRIFHYLSPYLAIFPRL